MNRPDDSARPPRASWYGARFYPPAAFVSTKDLLFDWLAQDLGPDAVVLDVGTGAVAHGGLRRLRARIGKLCGIDVDESILSNKDLDDARVVADDRWPYPDATFDAVVSTYCLEHVEHPARFCAEMRRVLKPGCSFFFLTVNARHPGSVVGRHMPLGLFTRLIHRLSPLASENPDPLPTFFRVNTTTRLRRFLREAGFTEVECRTREEPPVYLSALGPAVLPAIAYERLANRCPLFSPIRLTLFGRAR